MNVSEKKAAAAAYKERKAAAGIYVVRCAPTGRQWVGRAPDLLTVWNREMFTLRHGSHPNRSLQAAWRESGADSFAFEEVERVDPDELAYSRERTLKERQAHWCATLGAEAI